MLEVLQNNIILFYMILTVVGIITLYILYTIEGRNARITMNINQKPEINLNEIDLTGATVMVGERDRPRNVRAIHLKNDTYITPFYDHQITWRGNDDNIIIEYSNRLVTIPEYIVEITSYQCMGIISNCIPTVDFFNFIGHIPTEGRQKTSQIAITKLNDINLGSLSEYKVAIHFNKHVSCIYHSSNWTIICPRYPLDIRHEAQGDKFLINYNEMSSIILPKTKTVNIDDLYHIFPPKTTQVKYYISNADFMELLRRVLLN